MLGFEACKTFKVALGFEACDIVNIFIPFFQWSIVLANHVDDLEPYIVCIETKLVDVQEVLTSTNIKKQVKFISAMRACN